MGGLFCFNFLNDKVNSEQSTPIGYNGSQLKEVADLTDKSMNGERNLIQAPTFIRGTKPAISFKVLLYADSFFFSVNSLKNILIIFLCVGNNGTRLNCVAV